MPAMKGERAIILRQTTVTETVVTLRQHNKDRARGEAPDTFHQMVRFIKTGGPQVFGFYVGNAYSYANWSYGDYETETIEHRQEYAIRETNGAVSTFKSIDD